jgi:hypothetical protein
MSFLRYHLLLPKCFLPNSVATGVLKVILNSKVTIMGTHTLVVSVNTLKICGIIVSFLEITYLDLVSVTRAIKTLS